MAGLVVVAVITGQRDGHHRKLMSGPLSTLYHLPCWGRCGWQQSCQLRLEGGRLSGAAFVWKPRRDRHGCAGF